MESGKYFDKDTGYTIPWCKICFRFLLCFVLQRNLSIKHCLSVGELQSKTRILSLLILIYVAAPVVSLSCIINISSMPVQQISNTTTMYKILLILNLCVRIQQGIIFLIRSWQQFRSYVSVWAETTCCEGLDSDCTNTCTTKTDCITVTAVYK